MGSTIIMKVGIIVGVRSKIESLRKLGEPLLKKVGALWKIGSYALA